MFMRVPRVLNYNFCQDDLRKKNFKNMLRVEVRKKYPIFQVIGIVRVKLIIRLRKHFYSIDLDPRNRLKKKFT